MEEITIDSRIEEISEEIKRTISMNLRNSLPGDVITITINLKVS